MNRERLERLLTRVRIGKVTVPAALEQLRALPFEDLGFASLDHHRSIRQSGKVASAEVVRKAQNRHQCRE